MIKKEIRDDLKDFLKTGEENNSDVKSLDILNAKNAEYASLDLDQGKIQRNVNIYTREKAFNLTLDDGPYKTRYTSNGAWMLINNSRGYIATYNTQTLNLGFESNLQDAIYDTHWLHNELYMAAAQKDCVFIYDNCGVELHAVREMVNTKMLEFLPYHFLLTGVTDAGVMHYLDTSIGEIASTIFIGDKNPTVVKSNPSNAVIHLGSKSGCVSLWAPSQKSYLAKIKCHKSAISNIEVDLGGNRMITTGLDNRLCVFDIRNTFSPMKAISTKTNVHHTALSQKNLLAMAYSNKMVILKDFEDLYMKHSVSGVISSIEFCSHEDILSIGHLNGVSNIVVPGSGDSVYDSNECSPFMNKRERKRLEVNKLLDKIPADTISQSSVFLSVDAPAKKMPAQQSQRYFGSDGEQRNALSRFYAKK